MQQAAGQAVEPGGKATKHVIGKSRAKQDFAHPDEHRQGRQVPAITGTPEVGSENGPRVKWAEKRQHNPGGADQTEGDPDPAAEQKRQGGNRCQAEYQHNKRLPFRINRWVASTVARRYVSPSLSCILVNSRKRSGSRMAIRSVVTSVSTSARHSRPTPVASTVCGIHSGIDRKPEETSLKSRLSRASSTKP